VTALSPNRVAWVYTDDDGNDYVVAAQKAITDQVDGSSNVKVGGSAAAGTEPLLPYGFKMRRVNCQDSAGHRRQVVAYEVTAPLWATPGTTLNLNYLNNSTSFEAKSTHFKERPLRRSQITDAT